MKKQLIKLLCVSFSLIAPFLFGCRSKKVYTTQNSAQRTQLNKWENETELLTLGLFVIDSLVTITPRDTSTSVRYVRATQTQQSSREAATTQLVADTAAAEREEITQIPIAAESIKKGGIRVRSSAKVVIGQFFFIFLLILWLCVKKFLPLHRNSAK